MGALFAGPEDDPEVAMAAALGGMPTCSRPSPGRRG